MALALKKITEDVYVPDDAEYIAATRDILENPKFGQMKNYIQHGQTSCLEHCVAVSYLSYLACKKRGWDAVSVARGALLHDFFLYDWHFHYEQTGNRFHGLSHPRVALQNAEREFKLNFVERDVILNHMWPLTVLPPRFKESYVVTYNDKLCSMREMAGSPVI